MVILEYIPYGRQSINQEDVEEVIKVLKSDFITTGPKVMEFEQCVAKYCNVKYGVAVNSGTSALHIACMAASIGNGDEVITTPNTFVASSNAVIYCGGTPVFADILPDTYNIDPKDIERKITSRTKAIIAVHFAGQPCDMEAIHEIAIKYNLIVIEDGAHALGAEYNGKRIGSLSHMTTFSFHPVKHITTCEGGMVVTDSVELYNKLLLLRSHGITRDEEFMEYPDKAAPWYYEQIGLGYNYRISDVQCALGISQMKRLDVFIEKRKKIARRYDEAFKHVEGIITPFQQSGCNSSYHLYPIQITNKERLLVFNKLRESNIGVNVHYIPVYTQPYYRKNGYSDVICKNAEQYYDNAISLPIFYEMTEKQQEYVIEKVKEFVL